MNKLDTIKKIESFLNTPLSSPYEPHKNVIAITGDWGIGKSRLVLDTLKFDLQNPNLRINVAVLILLMINTGILVTIGYMSKEIMGTYTSVFSEKGWDTLFLGNSQNILLLMALCILRLES